MGFKHKIVGPVGKQLAEMVDGLPRMAKMDRNGYPVYKKQPMMGVEMNLHGARDENGKKYADNVLYNAPVLVYVDHLEAIREVFKSDGMDGAQKYVEEVLQRKEEMNREAKKMAYDQTWHRKLVLRFQKMFK